MCLITIIIKEKLRDAFENIITCKERTFSIIYAIYAIKEIKLKHLVITLSAEILVPFRKDMKDTYMVVCGRYSYVFLSYPCAPKFCHRFCTGGQRIHEQSWYGQYILFWQMLKRSTLHTDTYPFRRKNLHWNPVNGFQYCVSSVIWWHLFHKDSAYTLSQCCFLS